MGNNLFRFWFGISEVGSIGLTMTTCQLHVHEMSDPLYLEARCDTQTFGTCRVGEKFVFDSGWRFSGGLDLNNYDTQSVLCANDASCDAPCGLMRHPDIRTCCDAKNLSLVFGVRSICKSTITCQWHVPMWSDELYCSACRDTQTFELALMQKNLSH